MLSTYTSEHLQTDVFVFWKFEQHLMLDVQTTFRLLKLHCENFWYTLKTKETHCIWKPGADPDILKRRGALYIGHHGWPAKKKLGFRWSKKDEITLETIGFWQNISISIFKFLKFNNTLIRKEKKRSYNSQWEKKNWEKLDFVL